ncbi:MAG: hypothetical protein ACXQTC_04320 [Methanopyraceae archaeon]
MIQVNTAPITSSPGARETAYPAIVNLRKDHLLGPQQPGRDVTVNDDHRPPFAHDIAARIVTKDGPNRDSVDHVVRDQPAGSAGNIERCPLGVLLYSEETTSTQQGQSVRHHCFVACGGWDAVLR